MCCNNSVLRGDFTKDCFFQSAHLDQIVPDESIFLIGPIVVLNRLKKVIGYSF